MADEPRYAIYYCPPVWHPLTRAAVRWLGRDAFDSTLSNLAPDNGGEAASVTTEPRRYGFHATLKAPFRLAAGRYIDELEDAIASFVAGHRPCPLGAFRISLISGFFALVPAYPSQELRAFASNIVERFDDFRAPPNETEVRRRLNSNLDDTEIAYVARWGYPYVFDRFRFHMTLTDKLSDIVQLGVLDRLEMNFGTLVKEDYEIDALTLFEQKSAGSDFFVRSRFAFKEKTSS